MSNVMGLCITISHACLIVCVPDIQSSASNVTQQKKSLLAEIKTLQEKVAMLENERDFLRTTLTTAMASTGRSSIFTFVKGSRFTMHFVIGKYYR